MPTEMIPAFNVCETCLRLHDNSRCLPALLLAQPSTAAEIDARDLVRQAMDHWRGLTSHSKMTMTIHRPDWERTMTMESWSKGDKLSLVRVIEPKQGRRQWHPAQRQQHVDLFAQDQSDHQGAFLDDVAKLDGQRFLQQGHRQVHRHHRPVRP